MNWCNHSLTQMVIDGTKLIHNIQIDVPPSWWHKTTIMLSQVTDIKTDETLSSQRINWYNHKFTTNELMQSQVHNV